MINVDVSNVLHRRHHSALRALTQLGKTVDQQLWCLVGGLMVFIALAERGSTPARALQTRDADVVVDICSSQDVMSDFVYELESYGFVPMEPFLHPDAAQCTFMGFGGNGQIDVLCPDDASPSQLDGTLPIRQSCGTRRALRIDEC